MKSVSRYFFSRKQTSQKEKKYTDILFQHLAPIYSTDISDIFQKIQETERKILGIIGSDRILSAACLPQFLWVAELTTREKYMVKLSWMRRQTELIPKIV